MRFISKNTRDFSLHHEGLYETVNSDTLSRVSLIETDEENSWMAFVFHNQTFVVGQSDTKETHWLYCIREPLAPGKENELFETQVFSVGKASSAHTLAHELNSRHKLWASGLVVYIAKLLPKITTIYVENL